VNCRLSQELAQERLATEGELGKLMELKDREVGRR